MKKLLFICMGNTCRSPMAAKIFKKMFKSISITDIECDSAGWCTSGGQKASGNAVAVCAEIGANLENHVSKSVAECDLNEYDKLIFLDINVAGAALEAGIQKEKMLVMNKGRGIPDPYGGDIEIYRYVREMIMGDFFDLLPVICDVSVSGMGEKHIEQIAEIEKQSFSRPWSENGLREELENPNAAFFAAEIGDIVLGYAGMHCALDEGFIANIAVLPVFRGKGVASALLRRFDEIARERKLSRLTLEVRQSNEPAISLYKKFGFVEDGIRKNFYRDPDEDAVIMSKYYNRTVETING